LSKGCIMNKPVKYLYECAACHDKVETRAPGYHFKEFKFFCMRCLTKNKAKVFNIMKRKHNPT